MSVPSRPWEVVTKVPLVERGIPDAHKMPATPMIVSVADDDRLIADCYDYETAEHIVECVNAGWCSCFEIADSHEPDCAVHGNGATLKKAVLALCNAINDGTVRVKDTSGTVSAFLRAVYPEAPAPGEEVGGG